MELEKEDSIINILDEVTANKIAAGEVIERPASVIKELVENALDAGADDIKIDLTDGGKKSIRVTDNGSGMSRKDAVLSLQRHATSKIASADDLFSIRSLGFRGEALPSMSSVSNMEIVTRREEDDCGTLVVCSGGHVQEVSDIGAPVGTSISVSDLFYNVPARQKFLKTAQTELGHVLELVNRYAISHCEAKLTVTHNDRQIFRTTGSNKLQDAVLTVFGRDAAESVMQISGRSGPYKVQGFVSRPSYSKANRSGQMSYVNRRFVRNRNLIHALDDAYRGILPQGRFPLLICFIEVDPELIDVNVHPTKMEVKFSKEWEIHNLLATSIRDALSSSAVSPNGDDMLPKAVTPIQRPDFAQPERRFQSPSAPPATTMDLEAFREALSSRFEQAISTANDMGLNQQVAGNTNPVSPVPVEILKAETDILANLVVLAQARNMYIVAQGAQGILLIDQHVAHERVLHDQLLNSAGEIHVQRLVVPVNITLGKRESLVLENKLDELKSLGFELEPFGKDTFLIRAVPAIIADKNYEQILIDTIDELTELTLARRLMIHREAIITTTACKMAIKAGERLSIDEMSRLMEDLRKTSNPYLCPHGRPIVVCISNRELDKMFGRM